MIYITSKMEKYLKDNNINFSFQESYGGKYLTAVRFTGANCLVKEHPHSCSEVDISTGGVQHSNDAYSQIVEILKRSHDISRITTRLTTNNDDPIPRIKGFTRICSAPSGHGKTYGTVHYFHKMLSKEVK